MPYFMIVLIPYINLSKLSWIIKCLFFLRNMEPLKAKMKKKKKKKKKKQHLTVSLVVFSVREAQRRDANVEVFCFITVFTLNFGTGLSKQYIPRTSQKGSTLYTTSPMIILTSSRHYMGLFVIIGNAN